MPGRSREMMSMFDEALSQPHSWILIDNSQTCNDAIRYRSGFDNNAGFCITFSDLKESKEAKIFNERCFLIDLH